MVLAAGVGGVAAGALQLVAHAATKSLLFLGAGAWLVLLATKQLGELRGAARRYPLVGVTFTVGAASLAGLPPLSLWVTKDLVLAAALEQSTALYVVGLVAAVISAVYSAKAVWWIWQPLPSDERRVRRIGTDERAVRRNGVLPLSGLAALAALLGIPVLAWAPGLWELEVQESHIAVLQVHESGFPELLSGGLAVAATAVTWRLAGRIGAPPLLASWLGVERLAHAVVVRPVLVLARALARFDDVLDGSVNALAKGTVAVARGLDRRGEGVVDGAVRGIADGARVLGRLARRPQTGQVHQYYAQAAAALAVLALVVIIVR
jgi:NADH-quinone oxidoreductase subunit L